MTTEFDISKHPDWHLIGQEEVLSRLGVDANRGLSADDVRGRRQMHGLNEILRAQRRQLWRIVLAQFVDFMILILIGAAVISGAVGEIRDALAIIVIVLLNAIVGATQEYRAERAVAALRRLTAPSARVVRDSQEQTIAAGQLVPGDVVMLQAGDIVPADLRLLEVAALKTDEATLTGESLAAEKAVAVLKESGLPLGDRKNMVYKGTLVVSGRATGVAVATGMATELGKIATLLKDSGPAQTPLQRRLARFGRRLAMLVIAVCVFIFAVGLLRGESLLLMFLTAVSLAVAAIPEALPAVVTVSLALGARKMSAREALIRRLPAVETLGSVTYICADKTGTLTENLMRVESVFADGRLEAGLLKAGTDLWMRLGEAVALNNDVSADASGGFVGDPTELALYEAARTAGLDPEGLKQGMPRLAEMPFDADRKRMTTLHRDNGGVLMFTKGAPESVVDLCREQQLENGSIALDRQALLAKAEALAAEGCRVLAFAYRRLASVPKVLAPEETERDLTFLGLVALIDPPRAAVAEAVAACQSAGITPVMITGDHPATALAIARRLGIADDRSAVMTGAELRKLSKDELDARAVSIQVFARVNPEQKIDIVGALQRRGEFVAMTGDGVNDAPALKAANIGVAMGRKGTEVAREAADMVLLDDNFATIVAAVREGRRIFDNIRKFIKYTMTSNSGEVWVLFLAPFFGLPLPLLPIHILWINLVTDGLPGLALATEPAETGIMRRAPRPPQESIFAHGMWQHMLWIGLLIGAVSLLAQAWSLQAGSATWQTMVFTVLTFSQLAHVMAIRSETASLFALGLWTNPLLLGAVGLTIALQLAVIYLPWLNPIFKTAPLAANELLVCFCLPLIVFIAVEIEKWLVRQGWLYATAGRAAHAGGRR